MIDPATLYGADRIVSEASIDCILTLDWRASDGISATGLPPDQALTFMDAFSLGLRYYHLEEDLFDCLGNSLANYVHFVESVHERLRRLCNELPFTVLSADVRHPSTRRRVVERIANGELGQRNYPIR